MANCILCHIPERECECLRPKKFCPGGCGQWEKNCKCKPPEEKKKWWKK